MFPRSFLPRLSFMMCINCSVLVYESWALFHNIVYLRYFILKL